MLKTLSIFAAVLYLGLWPFLALSQSLTVTPYAPELFPSNLSGAVCGFSSDGQTIYFVREDPGTEKLFLFEAYRNGDQWTNARLLPFSGEHSDMGGRFSPDGTTFYFTSDRPGGSGDPEDVWNIWRVERRGDGWSDPQPLETINNHGAQCCLTPISYNRLLFSNDDGTKEWFIFEWKGEDLLEVPQLNVTDAWQWPSYYSPEEQVLFFNSMKRPDTRGKDDVYLSRFQDGTWSEPINVGDVVNTSVYEDGAILSPDRRYLIFNQHGSDTPSRVMAIEWTPLRRRLFE